MRNKKEILRLLDIGKSKNYIAKKHNVSEQDIERLIDKERSRDYNYIKNKKKDIIKLLEEGNTYAEISSQLKIYRIRLTTYCTKEGLNNLTKHKYKGFINLSDEILDRSREYIQEGRSVSWIYKELKLSKVISLYSFYLRLETANIYKGPRARRLDKTLDKGTIEELLVAGYTYEGIAEVFKVSPRNISTYCRTHGLHSINSISFSRVKDDK